MHDITPAHAACTTIEYLGKLVFKMTGLQYSYHVLKYKIPQEPFEVLSRGMFITNNLYSKLQFGK